MRNSLRHGALVLCAVLAGGANAAPFTLTLTNTSTTAADSWSPGVLSLQPLIGVQQLDGGGGLTPRPGTNPYFTYVFTNAHCQLADTVCPGGVCSDGGSDDGNAVALVQRWGLTLGTNAWIVPAIPANNGSVTVTIDAPPGSRLSYIAWVNDVSVFDDFVAMHPPGDPRTLSVPLFDSGGTPLQNVDFVISGYDSNSTSPTDGSGTTCMPECPTATSGCFVAPGNASSNGTGTFPPAPTPPVANFTITSGNGNNRLWWTNNAPHAGVVIARDTQAITWTPTNGVTYAANQSVGGAAATGTITSVSANRLVDGETFTLRDGTNPATVFEFNSTGGVTAGRIAVPFSAGQNATTIAAAIVTAINGVGATLRITASNAGATVNLVNDVATAAGNLAITETVASATFVVTGMAGGATGVTIVYADDGAGAAAKATDPGTNGTRYFYKVFAHANGKQYASGDVPTSAGLFSIPTAGAPGSPAWCYSVGMLTTQQPYTDFGVGVYTSSQARAVTGNVASDGTEAWRPAVTTGITQSRPTVTPLFGRSSKYLVTGDQSGFTYAIDVANGQRVWVGNGGASIGLVQAQATVELNQYTDPATDAGISFRNKYPNTDLVFFGTRVASTTANSIWALSSTNGAKAWSLAPGNLDIISGGMVLDYETNRLWVASRSGGGGQPSLRVIDVINPAAAPKTFNLGDIDDAVVRNTSLHEIHVVTNAGVAYGFDSVTYAQNWTLNLGGAVSGYLVPVANGFIASTPNGVQLYKVTTTALGDGGFTHTVAPQWPTPAAPAPTAIVGPSAARVDSSVVPYKLYVSDSTGKLNRLDYATGAFEASLTVSTTGLGMPSIDPTTTPKRLYVGGQDGRLCAVDLPF